METSEIAMLPDVTEGLEFAIKKQQILVII